MGQCHGRVQSEPVPVRRSPVAFGTRVTLQKIMHAWRLRVIRRKHAYETDLAHVRIARLHQQLVDKDIIVQNALERLQDDRRHAEPPTADRCRQTTCVVCMATTSEWATSSCARHDVCFECLSKLCAMHADPTTPIHCPSTNECVGAFADDVIASTVEGRRVLAERQHRQTVEMICPMMGDGVDERVALRMRYLKSDGTYSALQCPACGFGPIEHTHCDDLREFHRKNGIVNSCPRCCHFEDSVAKLVPWSGV